MWPPLTHHLPTSQKPDGHEDRTPLACACEAGSLKCAKLIRAHLTDAQAKGTVDQRNVLHFACGDKSKSQFNTGEEMSAIAEFLVAECGIKVDSKDSMWKATGE